MKVIRKLMAIIFTLFFVFIMFFICMIQGLLTFYPDYIVMVWDECKELWKIITHEGRDL